MVGFSHPVVIQNLEPAPGVVESAAPAAEQPAEEPCEVARVVPAEQPEPAQAAEPAQLVEAAPALDLPVT